MATMKGKGIPVANPFACLKTEEEIAEERKARRKEQQQQQTNGNSKKDQDNKRGSNKPKKSTEKERLQQLAFGFSRPGSSNPEPPKPASAGKKKGGKNRNANNDDWQQWREHDQEVVEDQFKDDLEKALLESQVQMEKKKMGDKENKERVNSNNEAPDTAEGGKKKKRKDKSKTMSLEEFNNLQNPKSQKVSEDAHNEEPSRPPIHHRVPSADKDSKFFNSAQHEAKQIMKKDKMKEEYRKTVAVDNAVVAKLKNDIEIRDKTIKDLKEKMEKFEGEMKQVKHRNKQLCVILAQGEMKDKAQVLLQVDELNNVKDELMEQVTSLTAELEKEKSKNRALKADADKSKGGKHGK